MKTTIATAVLVLIGLTAHAQKIIEKTIAHNDRAIALEVKFASSITVRTWDKPQVYIKATIRTEGQRYQDDYKLHVTETANTIRIESDVKAIFEKFKEAWEQDPDKRKNYYNTSDQYTFTYTLFVPKDAALEVSSINGSLSSENITGTFTADLINGDIEIAKYSGNLELSTINGIIDMPLTDVQMVAETVHGEIYLPKNVKFESSDRRVGEKISANVDGATHRLVLNTVNGNMYLRNGQK